MDAEVLKYLHDFMGEVKQYYTIDFSELCKGLLQERIPTTPAWNRKQMKIIKRALCAILAIGATYQLKVKSDPTITSILVESWPAIWAWISFLHQKCIVDRVYSVVRRIMALRVIPSTLTSLGRDRRLRKTITDTPSVMAMLAPH